MIVELVCQMSWLFLASKYFDNFFCSLLHSAIVIHDNGKWSAGNYGTGCYHDSGNFKLSLNFLSVGRVAVSSLIGLASAGNLLCGCGDHDHVCWLHYVKQSHW